MKTFRLKSDRFRKARGGTARLVNIVCNKCGTQVLVYQKDGMGRLLRCYLDRIFAPLELERLQHDVYVREPRDLQPLVCRACDAILGVPIRHHSGRLGFRLLQGAFFKEKA